MIGIIACVTQNGVIGDGSQLAVYYKEDMEFFKKTTSNSTIIMGRKTFESIGKPLKNRQNIVISSKKIDSIEFYSSLREGIEKAKYKDTWLIGGYGIYEEGLKYADVICLSITKDIVDMSIKFPWINPLQYKVYTTEKLSDDVTVVKYTKI